jgi:hypothetical protein
LSNGVNRTNIYTDKFGVRYRMQSNKTGCYLVSMNGDDGFRLYVDGVLVFNSWSDKGNTVFGSVLIYLTGTSELVFDYYENGGGNVVGFSMTPFVVSSNTITAPAAPTVCSGTTPGAITGSLTYNGATANPTINFQWQSSPDNATWTDIPGATSQNYTPMAVTTTTSNVTVYYRRIVVGSSAATSGCTYTSNVISITTSAALGSIGSITGSTPQCVSSTGLIYSTSPVVNALTYNWSIPSNWTITAGAGTNTITVSIAANGVSGNVSVTASNSCGTSSAAYLSVTVDPVPSKPGTATGYSPTCTGYTAQWAYTNYATKYFLDVSLNAGFTSFVSGYSNLDVGNVTAYVLAGLNPGTTYYYRVRAYSNCGTSVSSNNMTFATSPAPTVAPVANAASGVQCNAVTVNWNTVANATGYYLDIATDSGFTTFVSGYNNYNISYSANSFYAGGLPAGTLYYRLRGYNSCGTTASSNTINFSTTSPVGGTVSPAQTICSGSSPANLTLSGNSGTAAIIGWQKAVVSDFSSYTPIAVTSATLLGTTIGNLSANTYFRAVVQIQSGSYCTSYSTPVLITVTSAVGTPTSITIAAGSEPSCQLTNATTITTYVTTATNNTGFSWSLSNAVAGSINSSGVMTWSNGFSGSVDIQVRANGCNGLSSQVVRTVVVQSLPATPTASATSQPSCLVSSGIISVTAPTGSGISYSIDGSDYSNTSGIFSNVGVGSYTVTAKNASGCISLASTPIAINASTTNTWNGTSWSAGTPTASQSLIFNGDYSSAASINGCSCQVNPGKTVTILSGGVMTITNAVTTGGTLIFENNASLIQLNDDAVNTGVIIYKRETAPMKNFDYTYWSSPVEDQVLHTLSPNTLLDKYMSYSMNKWEVEMSGASMMTPGKGYIIRVPKPQFWPNPMATTYIQPVEFEGVPNNGAYTFPIDPTGYSNLIGNPYPSAMSANAFLLENSVNTNRVEGTIRLWTHSSVITNQKYAGADYASYNMLGGTAAVTGGEIPLGNIASGQSFFVKSATVAGPVVLNNSMRVGVSGENAQFFKGTKSKTAAVEKHRVWLSLSNTEGAFRQMLVGYATGATNGIDNAYDGATSDSNKYIDFYSINGNANYIIQGRAVPFDKTDKVPLGYKSTIEGTFVISIDKVDGVLATQTVFVEDKVTNTIHNLKDGSYSFTTLKGIFNDRFVLRYTDNTPVVVPPVVVDPPIVVTPPVVIDPPVVVTPPVVVDPPIVVTPPVVIDPPVVVTPPVVVDPPIIVTPPVVVDPPIVVDPPVVVTPPVVVDPPIVVTPPVVVDPPVVVTPPVVVDPPIVVTPPVVIDPPVVVTPPVVVDPPIVVTPPVAVDPPVVVTPPVIVIPPVSGLDPTLENPSFDKKGKSVIVSVKDRQIKVNSFDETIASLMVYDLRGRLLYENDNVNKNEFVLQDLNSSDQFLIVITQLTNGKWVTKEIIFKN